MKDLRKCGKQSNFKKIQFLRPHDAQHSAHLSVTSLQSASLQLERLIFNSHVVLDNG